MGPKMDGWHMVIRYTSPARAFIILNLLMCSAYAPPFTHWHILPDRYSPMRYVTFVCTEVRLSVTNKKTKAFFATLNLATPVKGITDVYFLVA